MLRVRIFSFSYLRSGIPEDETANGGGFVFDCRGLQNPGIVAEFMHLTGKDTPVVDLLEKNREMQIFIGNVCEIVDLTVDNFIGRGFTDLMVSFGCTGGQHRSVYAAEKLKVHLTQKYKDALTIDLVHRDMI